MSVALGTLQLANPVMNASGTMGYGHEAEALTAARELGAIVTKTVTLHPRGGNFPPRLWETPAGLLNSIGLQNVGVTAFVRDELPRLRELGPPVIVSVGGNATDEYARCVAQLEGAAVHAYEINISCPNVAAGGIEFGRDAAQAAEVITAVRRRTSRPLLAKLTPNVTDITVIGRACIDAGADGLTAVNTFVGMAIDVERARPVLPRGIGGLSGPAIRPLALARVWELSLALGCPIVGVGGVVTAHDALEFLLAGATAVQVGTALLREPGRAARLIAGLAQWMRRKGIGSIGELIGALQQGAGPGEEG